MIKNAGRMTCIFSYYKTAEKPAIPCFIIIFVYTVICCVFFTIIFSMILHTDDCIFLCYAFQSNCRCIKNLFMKNSIMLSSMKK